MRRSRVIRSLAVLGLGGLLSVLTPTPAGATNVIAACAHHGDSHGNPLNDRWTWTIYLGFDNSSGEHIHHYLVSSSGQSDTHHFVVCPFHE